MDHFEIKASTNKVFLERVFPCSVVDLWKCWTEPQLISKWFGSDPKGTVEHAEVDLKIGSGFSVSFRNDNGDRYTCNGTYLDLVLNSRIRSTWYWTGSESHVEQITVEFKPENHRTRMVFVHENIDPLTSHGYLEGWTSTFDKLQRVVEEMGRH